MARSRVLVAWYSKSYARSRPCQWELRAAMIIWQIEKYATKRVLALNPEADTKHIVQTSVRDVELISALAKKRSGAVGNMS